MYAPVMARETAGGRERSDSFPTAWLKLDLGNTRSSWAAAKVATLTAPEPTFWDQARYGTSLPPAIELSFRSYASVPATWPRLSVRRNFSSRLAKRAPARLGRTSSVGTVRRTLRGRSEREMAFAGCVFPGGIQAYGHLEVRLAECHSGCPAVGKEPPRQPEPTGVSRIHTV